MNRLSWGYWIWLQYLHAYSDDEATHQEVILCVCKLHTVSWECKFHAWSDKLSRSLRYKEPKTWSLGSKPCMYRTGSITTILITHRSNLWQTLALLKVLVKYFGHCIAQLIKHILLNSIAATKDSKSEVISPRTTWTVYGSCITWSSFLSSFRPWSVTQTSRKWNLNHVVHVTRALYCTYGLDFVIRLHSPLVILGWTFFGIPFLRTIPICTTWALVTKPNLLLHDED